MSNPNYDGNASAAQNPYPYSENNPNEETDPLAGSIPRMRYGTAPPMPLQNQPYDGSPVSGSNRGPALQPLEVVVITPVQPTNEPDYLAFSLFTMVCCFLPLGTAALIFSIQTREANLTGNSKAAQRNSRLARIFARIALGVGVVAIILLIIFLVTIFAKSPYQPPDKP